MVPIESVAVMLWLLFGLVGLVRRFPVELGTTVGLCAMLFMLQVVGDHLGSVAIGVAGAAGAGFEPDVVRWVTYSTVILVWVFFMYAGETLTFPGVWPPNKVTGAVADVTIGLFNGWIVVGTWWWATDALGYPMQRWGWFVPPLTDRARALLAYTPQALIPQDYAAIVIGAFLVFLIALRVFR
jgi:hypothetical protein